MRILITGGAGFIGSQLALYLDKKDHEVIILDNLSSGYIYNFMDSKRLLRNFVSMDIRDPKIESVTRGVDVIFHIAGYVSLPGCNDNPGEAYSVNTSGTANVLEMARRNNVKKVVFASTAALYEKETLTPFKESLPANPTLIYARSKKDAEGICESFREMYGMDITIFRFFNVYGPHMDYRPPSYLISYLIGCLLKKEKPVLHSNGKQSRDFVYVDDVVRLCEIVMSNPKSKNQTFNVGSGEIISVQGIYDLLAEIMKLQKIKPVFRDPKMHWEKFPRQFEGKYKFDTELLTNEVNKLTHADISKAEKLLGWKPRIKMRKGLERTVSYSINTFKTKLLK